MQLMGEEDGSNGIKHNLIDTKTHTQWWTIPFSQKKEGPCIMYMTTLTCGWDLSHMSRLIVYIETYAGGFLPLTFKNMTKRPGLPIWEGFPGLPMWSGDHL